MFTGIVQGSFKVVDVRDQVGLKTFVVKLTSELIDGLKTGASVSVDGVCHTAVKIEGDQVTFDAMDETLRKTTIANLEKGHKVNIERSAKIGDEIGGHIMSGHIVGTAEIIDIKESDHNRVLTLKFPKEFSKFIFNKGFIGLDGCSLTIVDYNKEEQTFDVWLIPETLRLTGFGKKGLGDQVNIEIDSRTQAIVETVEQYLKSK